MKHYIKKNLKKLLDSDTLKIEINLKNKNDYKKNICRLIYNKFILLIQQKIVPCHFKNWLLRTTGMKVGFDVCIPHDIYFDTYFPELIELKRGCLVGGLSKFYTHEIKDNKLILGKNIIEARTIIGGFSEMMPGSVVGKNSLLNMESTLNKVMPEGVLWGGRPAKEMMKFSNEEIEKFFKKSDRNYSEYYKDFKIKVNAFIKDPKQNYLKIYYNGKRLNAGNDWWRARNFFRIWYNGAIMEICRLLPHSFLKTWLFRAIGIKIGKNVYIGKGVTIDHIYCDTVTIEDNVRLDDYVYIDGHEYTITQTVFGKVLIKKGAIVRKHAYVRTACTIGENTIIEPHSMAQREIPSNEIWEGVPAKFKKKRNKK